MQTAAILRAHEIQSIGQLFRGVMSNHGAWLDHESLPAYFKLTAWIAANVYAYVHGHTRTHQPHNQHEISSKTLSTSSLTINAPLIVKDEVDKRFRILFHNKTKNPMWA